MKLYGYIKVDSEGFGDGTEADVAILTDKEEVIKSAYEDYKDNLDWYKEWESLDDCYDTCDSYEDFKNELLDGYVLIQGGSSHVQYEWFEREV